MEKNRNCQNNIIRPLVDKNNLVLLAFGVIVFDKTRAKLFCLGFADDNSVLTSRDLNSQQTLT